MALSFDGSNDEAQTAAVPVSNYPFTIACWFNANNVTANGALAGICDDSGTGNFHMLEASGAQAGDPVSAYTQAGGAGGRNSTSTSYSASVWNHGAGVWASATDRRVFLNGGGKATQATSRAYGTPNRTFVGSLHHSSPTEFFPGRIAEVGFWNAALTDAEINALARGVNPLRIRPGNLILYLPLLDKTPTFIINRSQGSVRLLSVVEAVPAGHAPVSPALFAPAGQYAVAAAAPAASGYQTLPVLGVG